MRVKLSGINVIRKKLSNGETRTYHYDRATGARIEGQPGTAAFSISRENAGKGAPKKQSSILDISDAYFGSAEFNKLAENTKEKYRFCHKRYIRDQWGNAPIAAFSDRRIRGDVISWRDAIAANACSMADDTLMVLRIIINCAVDRGLLERNHLHGIQNVYSSDRSERIWGMEQTDLILSAATPEMQWLIQMGLLTLQRLGDLRAMEWAAIQNGRLVVRAQEKNKAAVSLSIDGPLAELLETIPHRAPTILTSVTGRPWTDGAFRKAWGKLLKKTGLHGADLHFHDLRGTGATLIADAGRPFHEIAAMTGHSPQGLNRILPRYVKLNSTHANNAQSALNQTWAGKLQTKLQTVTKNP